MWRLSWPEFHPNKPLSQTPQWSPGVARRIAELDPVHAPEAFSPTALLLMHGEDDRPMLDGMLSLHQRIEAVYAATPERLQLRLFPGGHDWPTAAKQAGLDWLSLWLQQ